MACACRTTFASVAILVLMAFEVSCVWDSEYASMSDIDWRKRATDNWVLPKYASGSMADADWGWRKRADLANAWHPRWQRSYALYSPRTSRFGANKNRQYSYRSMADMDWGWRKRSDDFLAKRHVGSLSRGIWGRGSQNAL